MAGLRGVPANKTTHLEGEARWLQFSDSSGVSVSGPHLTISISLLGEFRNLRKPPVGVAVRTIFFIGAAPPLLAEELSHCHSQ